MADYDIDSLTGSYDKQDIMQSFIRGKFDKEIRIAEKKKNSHIRVELGYGNGIGNMKGSSTEYMKLLSSVGMTKRTITDIGKDINIGNNSIPSIVGHTHNFTVKDNPVILVKYYGLMNKSSVLLTWKKLEDTKIIRDLGNGDEEDDTPCRTIYYSGYNIPDPQSVRYKWWDEYSVYFYSPENLGIGSYVVEITTMQNRHRRLVSNIEFTKSAQESPDALAQG